MEFDLLPAVPRLDLPSARRACGGRSSSTTLRDHQRHEGHGSAPETIAVYRQLWERGELTMRVGLVVSPSWVSVAEARKAMRDWLAYARGRGVGDPWLRISGVHIAYGGDATVAAPARAHLPDTGWSGFVEQAHTADEFREVCFLAAEHELRLHTIVADKLHEVVPVLEAINERFPLADRRWVIEHVGRARMDDLRALKRLGLYVTTIPTYFLWKGGRAYLDDPDGGDMVVPHRHMLDLGLPVAIATDNIPTIHSSRCGRRWRDASAPPTASSVAAVFDTHTALRLFTVAGAQLHSTRTGKDRSVRASPPTSPCCPPIRPSFPRPLVSSSVG